MKTLDRTGQDLEQTAVEHERWTSAILTALHEMRSASAAGLSRWHGDLHGDDDSSISGSLSARHIGHVGAADERPLSE